MSCKVRFCGSVFCSVFVLVGVFFGCMNIIVIFQYSECLRFVEGDLVFDLVVESSEICFSKLCIIIFVINILWIR